MQALSNLGERVPVELLVQALGDANSDVQQAAVQALGARDLSQESVRILYRAACHSRRGRVECSLRLIHWLTDWPVLLIAILAQLLVLFPVLATVFPWPPLVYHVFRLIRFRDGLLYYGGGS